jgi:hypothetical protein
MTLLITMPATIVEVEIPSPACAYCNASSSDRIDNEFVRNFSTVP